MPGASKKISLPLLALAAFGMIYGDFAQAMLWKSRRQSTNVEDARGSTPSKITIGELELAQIIKAWRQSRRDLIDLGKAAQSGLEPFQSCPKLRAVRPRLMELRVHLSSEKLDQAVKSIEELPANLQVATEASGTADICANGFAAADKQLAIQQLKIRLAKQHYREKFGPSVESVLRFEKAYFGLGEVREPSQCRTYTDNIFTKTKALADSHQALRDKLDWYAERIQAERDALKRHSESSSCSSIGTSVK